MRQANRTPNRVTQAAQVQIAQSDFQLMVSLSTAPIGVKVWEFAVA